MIPDSETGQSWQREDSFPPISIVIPAHNESAYLPHTIGALQRTIDQLQLTVQLIVVNDASTDDTRSIAEQAGAEVVDVELRNIGAVRNAGAARAIHEWLFFLDADTELPVKTLIQSMTALRNGAAGGGAHVSIPDEHKISLIKLIMFYAVKIGWQSIGGWAAGCFMFCRRDVFESFGGFDEQYYAAEELFFSREVKQRGPFRIVRHPVLTSSRKLQNYSTLQLIRFIIVPFTQLRSSLQSKIGLELLYQDER